jgi:IPT/TIG domain-containing protein
MNRLAGLAFVLAAAAPAGAQELIVNGSFETPLVSSGNVGYFASIPGWTAESGRVLEIQHNCCGAAYAGSQLVELDSNSMVVTTAMYQDVPTTAGRHYTLRLAYSPRPNVADNRIEVWWDGARIATLTRSGVGRTTTSWAIQTYDLVASQATTRVRLADVSVPDGVGGYVDAVSVVFRPTTSVSSIVPATGSSLGGDPAHVDGTDFTTIADTQATIGGAAATVLAVTATRIDLLTPPGAGPSDVVVTNTNGSASLAAAYTFVAPEIAARFGDVNVGAGDREDVLLVNASSGDALREVVVGLRQPIAVVMVSPSSRSSARFALYAWLGAPDATTLRALPAGVGATVFPTPLSRGSLPQPVKIGNNFDPRLGAATFPTTPAPSQVGRLAGGIRRPIVVTLQPIVEDDGSAIPQHVSVGNAVILRVQ